MLTPDLAFKIMLSLYLFNLFLAPIAGLVSAWLNVAIREQKFELGTKVMRFKYEKSTGNIPDAGDAAICWMLFDLLASAVVFGVTGLLLIHLPLELVLAVGVLASSPFIARFVLDVGRGLKLNHKTGEAERITKLERELESLKKSKE